MGTKPANSGSTDLRGVSVAGPSYQMGSRMRPNFHAPSDDILDSTFVGLSPLDAMHSTAQSTMIRIANAAGDLRNMGQVKSEFVVKINLTHFDRFYSMFYSVCFYILLNGQNRARTAAFGMQ